VGASRLRVNVRFSIKIRKGNVHRIVLSACEYRDKEYSEIHTLLRVYVKFRSILFFFISLPG